jgi:hypothetical protein
MAANAGPNIEIEDLELLLDVTNTKSIEAYPNKTDHGISEWYCFENGTVTYARPYPDTTIYSIDTSGNIAEVVASTTVPSRGTFTCVANYRYFANKAVHFIDDSDQQRLVPASLYGTQFGNISTRYSSSTYYIHAPFADATVSVYNNVAGGINGTATTTVSVSRGSAATYVTSTENAYVIFESDEPIVMTCVEGSNQGDKLIMAPAATQVYRRRNAYERTVTNAAPSTVGTYYVADSTPCFTVEIADGSGGDACQGVGKEYLADTYAFGDRLSDYVIVAPYPNTSVNVYYYSGGQWNLYTTHELNGSETSPAAVAVDGNGGSFDDSGAAPYILGNNYLWYFESNNPIQITVNDIGNDEEILLGWMKEQREKLYISSRPAVRNLLKKRAVTNAVVENRSNIYTQTQNYIQLDGVDQRIQISNILGNYDVGTGSFSISLWIYPQSFSSYTHLFTFDDQSMFSLKAASSSGKIYFFGGASYRSDTDEFGTWTLALNQWQHVGFVRSGSTHTAYYNGELVGSISATAKNITCSNVFIGWGWGTEYTQQRRGLTNLYKRALSSNAMKNQFVAHRRRYGN